MGNPICQQETYNLIYAPWSSRTYKLNRAADLPQGSPGSVGVFCKNAGVWDSLKETFRSWKGFDKGAFAFGAKRLGFLVSTKYDRFKEMVAVSTFVFDGRHEGISEWSYLTYIGIHFEIQKWSPPQQVADTPKLLWRRWAPGYSGESE